MFGNAREAERHATAAVDRSKVRDVEYAAGLALSLAGDSSRSDGFAGDPEKRFPEDTFAKFTYAPVLRASAALGRGDPEDTMERLQVALPYELAVNGLNFRLNLGGLHSPRRRAVLSQVTQAKRSCPAPSGHRSPWELPRGAPGHHAVRCPRHHPIRQQPGRSLTPADASARASHAALQIGCTRPAVPRRPRRRSQPIHHWTTSAPRRPSATSALARVHCVEHRGSGLTRSRSR